MSEYDFDDELTEEEKNKLKNNTNPDEESNIKYSWAEEFQKNIIALLLNDKWFAVQCKDLVDPNYFVDEVHQLLCRNLYRYLDKYKLLPLKAFMIQEVEDFIKNKEEKIRGHYIAEVNLIYEKYIPNLDSREYLLEKILNFAKLMNLKIAFDKSLQLMKKDPEEESTWSQIQSVLKEALLLDRNFDPGLNYFESFEERLIRINKEEENLERFTTGFKSADDALVGGGPHRGEIYSWIGLSGTGKSLALVSAAWRNISQLGKKVLYISLEMSEDKIAERFDAQIAGVEIGKINESSDIIKKCIGEENKEVDDKRRLLIKQFPAGSMTVNTLKAYMQQLSILGFRPDLLIVDYIGEMKDYPNMPTWESRYRMVRDLRGLATEENVCIFTAMQPNKNAREAQNKELGAGVIDDTNLADSYGQIRPLDGCWSINQMHGEKEAGIARIFVIKHRHGKSRFTFYVDYDIKLSENDEKHKGTLAMREISKIEYEKRWKDHQMSAVDRKTDEELQQEELERKIKGKNKKKTKSKFKNDVAYNNIDDDEEDKIDLDKPDNIGDDNNE